MIEPTLLRKILDTVAWARGHALLLAEDFPEHGEALRRFSRELKQAQEELFLRICPESDMNQNDPD